MDPDKKVNYKRECIQPFEFIVPKMWSLKVKAPSFQNDEGAAR
jgi:hypothetical protein